MGLVAGRNWKRLSKALKQIPGGNEVVMVRNPAYAISQSGYSLYLAFKRYWSGIQKFVLMDGNVFCEPAIMHRILAGTIGNAVLIAKTNNADSQAVKAYGSRRRVTALGKPCTNPVQDKQGKQVRRSLGRFAGVVRLSYAARREALAVMQRWVRRGEMQFRWEDVIGWILPWYHFRPVFVDGASWVEIDSPEDLARAREMAERMERTGGAPRVDATSANTQGEREGHVNG